MNKNGGQDKLTGGDVLRSLVPIIIALGILVAINAVLHTDQIIPFLQDDKTMISFDNKMVNTVDNITLTINNGNKNPQKYITIDGLNAKSIINTTDFRNVEGRTITIPVSEPQYSNEKHQTSVGIAVPTITPRGSYDGSILVNNKTSVALTIATEPKISEAIIWVLIGILISVIFWEFIIYDSKSDDTKYMNQRYTSSSKLRIFGKKRPTRKIALIDAGTIIFGIAVGFFAVFNQSYIITLRVIQPIDIIALIGIGIGAGSLREFAAKVSEPKSNDGTPKSTADELAKLEALRRKGVISDADFVQIKDNLIKGN
jgi:hypothetical protein